MSVSVFDARGWPACTDWCSAPGCSRKAASSSCSTSCATPTGDTRHNALHVVWGLIILLALWPMNEPYRTTLVMLVFGVFYSLLAVAGVVLDKPFGLLLGPGENAFHFIVGPLALGLGIWSFVQLQRSSRSCQQCRGRRRPSSAVTGSADSPR